MKRRIILPAIFAALLVTAATAATNAKLVSMLDPQTRVVAGFNATAIKASPFGQHLLAQSTKGDMARFIANTGFDARTNLQEVLFGASGVAHNSPHVLLAKGSFVPSKVFAYATNKGGKVADYQSVKVAQFAAFRDKRGRQHGERWLAFLNTSTATFGTPDAVQHAIDRYVNNTAADSALASQIASASGKYDAWYVSTVPGAEAALSIPQSSNELSSMAATALQAVQSESMGVKFTQAGASVSGQAVTASDQEALSLADRLRYMASTEATQLTDKKKPTLASWVQKVAVTTQGPNVNWSVQIPEAQLDKMTQIHRTRSATTGGK